MGLVTKSCEGALYEILRRGVIQNGTNERSVPTANTQQDLPPPFQVRMEQLRRTAFVYEMKDTPQRGSARTVLASTILAGALPTPVALPLATKWGDSTML